MTRTQTLLPLGALLLLPLAAQIQGPQLGLLSRGSELRRIEGLSLSSRLSAPVDLAVACSKISAAPGSAMRWAACATADATLLLDLSGAFAARKLTAVPFENVTWSANGKALLVDATRVSDLDTQDLTIASVSLATRAISDAGTVAEDDVLAFDGEARLTVRESSVHRLEAGKPEEVYALDFAPRWIAASSNGDGLVAVAGQRLARISRPSGDIAYFELPVEASTLRLLADGSMLVVEPAPNEPGWLFRWNRDEGGSVRFVPGIAVEQSVATPASEVRQ